MGSRRSSQLRTGFNVNIVSHALKPAMDVVTEQSHVYSPSSQIRSVEGLNLDLQTVTVLGNNLSN